MLSPISNNPSVRRGFTLIELLTVIAIIGILAAIIIPTVGKVRETARGSQCISNLRQVGLAFNLYANDNKGFYPRGGQPQIWTQSLLTYLPGRGNAVTNKIYICPIGLQPPDGHTATVNHYVATFAIEASGSATTATGTSGAGPRHVSSIVNPSRTLLLMDGALNSTTYSVVAHSALYSHATTDMSLAGPDASGFQRLSFRHGGTMNVNYIDGHAAKIPWGDRLTSIPDVTVWNGR